VSSDISLAYLFPRWISFVLPGTFPTWLQSSSCWLRCGKRGLVLEYRVRILKIGDMKQTDLSQITSFVDPILTPPPSSQCHMWHRYEICTHVSHSSVFVLKMSLACLTDRHLFFTDDEIQKIMNFFFLGRSQVLFALVFLTRYVDLFTSFISLYNTVMKIFFLASSIGSVYLMYLKFKATYDRNHDTFR